MLWKSAAEIAAAPASGMSRSRLPEQRRHAGIDCATAFFASVPGGAAEMAVLGERYGGKVDRIVVAQSVIVLVTMTGPLFRLLNRGAETRL